MFFHSSSFRAPTIVVCVAIVLAGCNTTAALVIGGHVAEEAALNRSSLPSYAAIHEKLPPLADGYLRLYIYRPQVFGGYARPVAVVDGRFIGSFENGIVRSTKLHHGSVFVVDTPSKQYEVWLYTIDGTRKEDMERRVSVSSTSGRTSYLRYAQASTYSYFQPVAEAEAMPKIQKLTFTGYVRF